MSPSSAINELMKQPLEDLRREVRAKRALVAKMKLNIDLKKEKNSAAYRREKKEINRMLTVMNRLEKEGKPALQQKPVSRKISAPSKK